MPQETNLIAATLCASATTPQAMRPSMRAAQLGLLILATISILGGTLQMVLGQPDTTPRLDNVHRFMAGIYLSTGFICAWTAVTIRKQGTLVYLLAVGVFIAGCGRLLSISQVGLPQPASLWLGYLVPELLGPMVIAWCHRISRSDR